MIPIGVKEPRQIFWDDATPEDFKNVNLMDWIQDVGEITTIYERSFIRKFGEAIRSSPAQASDVISILDKLDAFADKEINEYKNAETFSRDGEPVDYSYGEFAGIVEEAKKLKQEIKKIRRKIRRKKSKGDKK